MEQRPMDFIVQGAQRISSPNPDAATQTPQNGWTQTQNSQGGHPRHWSPTSSPPPPPVPHFFAHQRGRHPIPPPFSHHTGGLPPPDLARPYAQPEPLGSPYHGRPWAHQFQQPSSPPTVVQANPIPLSMVGSTSSSSGGGMGVMGGGGATMEYPYGHPDPSAASRASQLSYQSPPGEMGPGMGPGLAPPGATSESRPMARPPTFAPPYEQHPASGIGFTPTPLMPFLPPSFVTQYPPHSSYPSQRPSQPPPSATPRAPRSVAPQPSYFSPLSHYQHEMPALPPSSSFERRRPGHTRARRSVNARYTMLDPSRDGDEDAPHGSRQPSMNRPGHRVSQSVNHLAMEDATVRQMQVIRGAMSSQNKLVVSKAALQSLQSVDIEQLPVLERICVICYNEFGVETPEGINEAPLRLPKCRHVFGDHCIKKWFEDSDSCPYCRDKLPSEPKHQMSSARMYMNMMRSRGGGLPQGLSEDVYMRIMAGLPPDGDLDEAVSRGSQPAERRSMPDEAGDGHRRIRPRRDSSEDFSHSDEDDRWASVLSGFPDSPATIALNERHLPVLRSHFQWLRATNEAYYGIDVLGRQGSSSQAAGPSAGPWPTTGNES